MNRSAMEDLAKPRRRFKTGWAVAVVYVALAMLCAWAAGEWMAQRERRVQVDTIHRTLEVQVLALRGTADRYNQIPYVTAQHADMAALLQAPRNAALLARANRYLQDTSQRLGSNALYLMDANGLTLAASNWQEPDSFVGKSYVFRPYFKDAMEGREGFFYGVGSNTRIPGLFFSSPVKVGGVALGVVAIKVSLSDMENAWRRARDPVFLADQHGIIFLGSVPDWQYRATRPLAPDELQWVRRHRQYGDQTDFERVRWEQGGQADDGSFETLTALDGRDQQLLSISERVPEFGWTLVVMKDLTPVRWARWTGRALVALLAVVLLLAFKVAEQRERRYREMQRHRQELEQRVQARTAELQDAYAFRKAMGDSLVVGMRARDLKGRIIYVNPALCEITGYSADQLMGQLPPYPYWHPEDMERHWQDNDAVLSGSTSMNGFESRIRHRDGHDVVTMVYSAPLIDSHGHHSGWMSSVVDISEQKRAEEQQREQAAKMQRTGRLASMGEMASTLAHELSQPLMALVTYAGAARALAERGQQAALLETLTESSAQARRAADIVNRIRGFVRQQTPGFQAVQLADVVTNVLALMRPEIRQQQARVLTETDPTVPAVQADRLLLEQVVLNLVLNALQAMQGMAPADKVVEVRTGRDASEAWVRVADKGPGIAEQTAAQLFDPFFTTKPDGLGLGLKICRTTVEAHRGRLVVENRADGGAQFTVYLPLNP